MADLGSMIVHLSVDTSGVLTARTELQKFGTTATQSLGKANQQATAFTRTVEKQIAAINDWSQKARTLGYLSTAVITAPIVAFGKASIKAAKDFEFSMAKIQGLAGIPESLVGKWSKDIKKLSGVIGQSPLELAESLYFVTSAGFKSAEAMRITEMAGKGAAAGMGKAADIADLLVSAMNAYKTSGLTAAHAMDVFTAAVREGKIEPDAFVRSLGPVISIAAELGVSLDQVTAGMAAMSLSGASAANTATYMRNIFMKLANPANQVEEALNRMKTSSQELRSSLRQDGLMPTLMKLKDLTEEYGESIFDVFPEMRALIGVLKLTGENLEYNKKIFESVANATGDFEEAYRVASSTMSMGFAKAAATAQAALIDLGMAIGQYLLPLVTGLAKALSALAGWISSLDKFWKGLIITVGLVAAAFGPLMLIISFTGYIYGIAIKAVDSLRRAYQRLTGVISVNAAAQAANATVTKVASKAAAASALQMNMALGGSTAAAIAAKTAAKGLAVSTAMMGGVIGLAVVAVGALVYALVRAAKKKQEFASISKRAAQAVEIERYSLDNVFESIKRATEGTKSRADAIQIANDRYGEYIGNMLTEKSTLDDIVIAQKRATDAMVARTATASLSEDLGKEFDRLGKLYTKHFDKIDQLYTKTFGVDMSAKFKENLNNLADDFIGVMEGTALNEKEFTEILPDGREIVKKLWVKADWDDAWGNVRRFYDNFVSKVVDSNGQAVISAKKFYEEFEKFSETKQKKNIVVKQIQEQIAAYEVWITRSREAADAYDKIFENVENPLLKSTLSEMGKKEEGINTRIAAYRKLGLSVKDLQGELYSLYQEYLSKVIDFGGAESVKWAEHIASKMKTLTTNADNAGIEIEDLASIMKTFRGQSDYLNYMAQNAHRLGIEFDWVSEKGDLLQETLKKIIGANGAATIDAKKLSLQLEALPPNLYQAVKGLKDYKQSLDAIQIKGQYNIGGFDVNSANLQATEELFNKLVQVKIEAERFKKVMAGMGGMGNMLFLPMTLSLQMLDKQIEDTAEQWKEYFDVQQRADMEKSIRAAEKLALAYGSLDNQMEVVNREIQYTERLLYDAATAAGDNEQEVTRLSNRLRDLKQQMTNLKYAADTDYLKTLIAAFGDYSDKARLLQVELSYVEDRIRDLVGMKVQGTEWESEMQMWITRFGQLRTEIEQLETLEDSINSLGSVFQSLGDIIGGTTGEWVKWLGSIINSLPQIIELINRFSAAKDSAALSAELERQAAQAETNQKMGEIATSATLTGVKTAELGVTNALVGAKEMENAVTQQNTAIKAANAGSSGVAAVAAGTEAAASYTNAGAKVVEAQAEAVESGAGEPFPLNIVAIALGVAAVIAGLVAAIPKPKKMKTGGVIPPGYPNDTFPAMLTSGEVVIPREKVKNQQYIAEILGVPGFAGGYGELTPSEKFPDIFKIFDKRVVDAITNAPVSQYSKIHGELDFDFVEEVVRKALERSIDPYTALAIPLQEKGKYASQYADPYNAVNVEQHQLLAIYADEIGGSLDVLRDKLKMAERLNLDTYAQSIQAFNGLGTLRPKDFGTSKAYGIELPEEGISMKKNPLYGRRIEDIRNNILLQSEELVAFVESIMQEYPTPTLPTGLPQPSIPIEYAQTLNTTDPTIESFTQLIDVMKLLQAQTLATADATEGAVAVQGLAEGSVGKALSASAAGGISNVVSTAIGGGDIIGATGSAFAGMMPVLLQSLLSLIPGIGPIFSTLLGGVMGGVTKGVAKMADGGVVPGGYPNDSFPALLTSGETVLPFDASIGRQSESVSGDVHFYIEGDRLVGILEKRNKVKSKF